MAHVPATPEMHDHRHWLQFTIWLVDNGLPMGVIDYPKLWMIFLKEMDAK